MSSRTCNQRGLGGVPLPGALELPANNESTNVSSLVVFPDSAVWDGPLVQRVATLSVIMLFTLAGNACHCRRSGTASRRIAFLVTR
ncbi:hypothetical protein MRX96_016044 [Rhipicephalus microplus]